MNETHETRSRLQAMEIARVPEAFTNLALVVTNNRPNAKKQLANEQKLTLKNWGI